MEPTPPRTLIDIARARHPAMRGVGKSGVRGMDGAMYGLCLRSEGGGDEDGWGESGFGEFLTGQGFTRLV